ncbi:hypothetical protein J6590_091635 [Homalodisca vitripennis]|nr:hypothetical protein J6590_091635 [Homalodisca vitripennis]
MLGFVSTEQSVSHAAVYSIGYLILVLYYLFQFTGKALCDNFVTASSYRLWKVLQDKLINIHKRDRFVVEVSNFLVRARRADGWWFLRSHSGTYHDKLFDFRLMRMNVSRQASPTSIPTYYSDESYVKVKT